MLAHLLLLYSVALLPVCTSFPQAPLIRSHAAAAAASADVAVEVSASGSGERVRRGRSWEDEDNSDEAFPFGLPTTTPGSKAFPFGRPTTPGIKSFLDPILTVLRSKYGSKFSFKMVIEAVISNAGPEVATDLLVKVAKFVVLLTSKYAWNQSNAALIKTFLGVDMQADGQKVSDAKQMVTGLYAKFDAARLTSSTDPPCFLGALAYTIIGTNDVCSVTLCKTFRDYLTDVPFALGVLIHEAVHCVKGEDVSYSLSTADLKLLSTDQKLRNPNNYVLLVTSLLASLFDKEPLPQELAGLPMPENLSTPAVVKGDCAKLPGVKCQKDTSECMRSVKFSPSSSCSKYCQDNLMLCVSASESQGCGSRKWSAALCSKPVASAACNCTPVSWAYTVAPTTSTTTKLSR